MLEKVSVVLVMNSTGKIIYQHLLDNEQLTPDNYFSSIILAFDSFSDLTKDTAKKMKIGDQTVVLQLFQYVEQSFTCAIIFHSDNEFEVESCQKRLELLIDAFKQTGELEHKLVEEIVKENDKEIDKNYRNLKPESKSITQIFGSVKEVNKIFSPLGLDAFFIIIADGLCLYKKEFSTDFNIDSTLFSGFVSAFRSLIKTMSQDEVRSLSLQKRKFTFRIYRMKKETLFFVLVAPADVDEKMNQLHILWLEFATYVFQEKYKEQIKKLEKNMVINSTDFDAFGTDLEQILRAKPKELADVVHTHEEHIVRLQNLIDELAQHVPINFLNVGSFLRVSGRKLLIPSDITVEQANEFTQKIEQIVISNFGKKLFEMAQKKSLLVEDKD